MIIPGSTHYLTSGISFSSSFLCLCYFYQQQQKVKFLYIEFKSNALSARSLPSIDLKVTYAFFISGYNELFSSRYKLL